MTIVEDKAIDAWAIYEYREHPKGLYHTCFVDGYKAGYEQAEKDLALTWEDMSNIHDIMIDLRIEEKFPPMSQQLYEEILRRFNEQRKNGKTTTDSTRD